MPEDLEGYLSVQKAAEKLKRSAEQVRRYLREGKLEGRRIGGQWFIRESAVAYMVRPGPAADDGAKQDQQEQEEEMELFAMDDARKTALARISARRMAIRERWEKTGIKVDVAAMVRDLREEAR